MQRRAKGLLGAVLLVLTSVALGQDAVSITAGMPTGATYVPDAWLPMRIDVRNTTDRPIEGTVRLTPTNPSSPVFRMPVKVAPQSRIRTSLWVYLPPGKPSAGDNGQVALYDHSGSMRARCEVAGTPASPDVTSSPNGYPSTSVALGVLGDATPSGDETMVQGVVDVLQSSGDQRCVPANIGPEDLPRAAAILRMANIVMLTGFRPDDLDPAQRAALLDYVAGGGVVLVSAPDVQLFRGSWLEKYLPVRLLGMRQMHQIQATGEASVRTFPGYYLCTEAVPGEGTVLLSDRNLVYAAYRPYGLGHFAFTSFPASSLDVKDPRSLDLWRQLANMDHRPIGTAGSVLSREYGRLMEPMLGKNAASWTLAASVVGLFLLIAIATHLVWRGPARPRAFVASLSTAVGLAILFALMAAMRQQDAPTQEALLTVTDAWQDGTASQQYVAIAGPKPAEPASLAAQDETTTLRPVLDRQKRPMLQQVPVVVQDLPIQPEQVSLVAMAQKVARDGHGAQAQGQFTARGLELEISNSLGQPLASAQLLWRSNRFGLPTLAEGSSSTLVTEAALRPDDEYTSAGGLTSQEEQHKGQILKATLEAQNVINDPRGSLPLVVGWTQTPPTLVSLQADTVDRSASRNLVRMGFNLKPSAPGEHVRVDAPFTTLLQAGVRGLPYDPLRERFTSSTLDGSWLIGIQAPMEIGVIRPTKVQITLDIGKSQHQITLRRGQVPGGNAATKANPAGPVLGQWDQQVGAQTLQFTPAADDYDASGTLWLNLEVVRTGAAGSLGVPPPWQLNRLNVDLEGDVVKTVQDSNGK